MFDVGFSELFLIALVALIVLGPERLPKAARFAGLWIRRARSHWHSVKSELEDELADEDMRRSILKLREELRDAHSALRDDSEQVRAGMMGASAEMMPLPDAAHTPSLDDAARERAAEVAARSLAPTSVEPTSSAADEQR